MNKLFVVALFMSCSNFLIAQPILTAANSNPILGDIDCYFRCNNTSISTAITGAATTRDYSSLTNIEADTLEMVTCVSTPYCDSFPTSTVAGRYTPSGNYGYFILGTGGRVEAIGSYAAGSGPGYIHYQSPATVSGPFPMTFGSSWTDTNAYSYIYSSRRDYIQVINVSFADGYGTLKTPAGIFTNVLREHVIRYVRDSSCNLLTGACVVSYDTTQLFTWMQPGNHFSLLAIETDNGLPYHITYGTSPTAKTSIEKVTGSNDNFSVFPVPADNIIHLTNDGADWQNMNITLTDMTGRELWNSKNGELSQNNNRVTIPVSMLPSGTYILHIYSGSEMIVKKIEIGSH